MPAAPIKTSGLTKRYGDVVALDGVDLELATGEALGFVGPNGAGKSTLMKILVGVARPSAGSARVLGFDVLSDSVEVRRRIGYLPGDLGIYRNLRAGAFLDFCLGFHPRPDRARARELVLRFDLPLRQRVKAYSTGMRQKLGLVQALAVGGEVLILDEPTRGLDPTAQLAFQDVLEEEGRRGRSILLSSHLLEEIERLCHRIVFIDRGRLLADDVIEAARERLRRLVRATFAGAPPPGLERLPGVVAVRTEGDEAVLEIDGPVGPVLAALAARGLTSLEYNRPSLQEVYRALYFRREAT